MLIYSPGFILLGLFLLTSSPGLFAQGRVGAGVYAYPSAGQSIEQMATDQFDCHNWSVTQSDFDPTRDYSPEPIPSTPPPTKSGGSADRSDAQNAARGGARGAAMSVVTGNPVTGVVIGSTTSVLFGKKKRKKKEKEEDWQKQHQQQLQQQETQKYVQDGTESYRGAYLACMTSKNYSVK